MKSILMIGGGVSGKAVAGLAEALNIKCRVVNDAEMVNSDLDEVFSGVDQVVVSPGVLPASRLYQGAVERKKSVISELELGMRHFPGKCVAVTGTNGKTTTVELTEFILKKLGRAVVAAGNIGLPLSAVAAQILRGEINDPENLIAVLEVSSFQLEHTHYLPAEAAVLLNIESDHINRYPGGLVEYRSVKERIFQQVPPEKCFYGCTMTGKAEAGMFRIAGDMLCCGENKVVELSSTALNALHNRENLLAALGLVQALLPLEKHLCELAGILQEFKTGDHRISLVTQINGVKYIDDSKATNPAAVIAAVKSLRTVPAKDIVLIAGGLDKDMDFSPLSSLADYLRKVIVYGRCKDSVAAAFTGKVEVFDAENNFALAVDHASEIAHSGDTVLLSPAAASMDMFKDYKERGNVFADLVRKLSK